MRALYGADDRMEGDEVTEIWEVAGPHFPDGHTCARKVAQPTS